MCEAVVLLHVLPQLGGRQVTGLTLRLGVLRVPEAVGLNVNVHGLEAAAETDHGPQEVLLPDRLSEEAAPLHDDEPVLVGVREPGQPRRRRGRGRTLGWRPELEDEPPGGLGPLVPVLADLQRTLASLQQPLPARAGLSLVQTQPATAVQR